jgi:hypothetical protein
MRALPPSLALVDLYADPKAWHPDIDDVDIPAERFGAVVYAGGLLNVELPIPLQNELGIGARLRRSTVGARSIYRPL